MNAADQIAKALEQTEKAQQETGKAQQQLGEQADGTRPPTCRSCRSRLPRRPAS